MSPLVVVWRVTERCDAACGFCAYDARLRRPRREVHAAEALRFGGLVADFAAAAGRRALVSWLGGEPFLWRPLAAVSEALRARGVAVSLTTNGRALADPARLAWAAGGLDEITLSLDGAAEAHDALRGRAKLAGTVLAAIRALRAAPRPPRIRVNTVLMTGTAGGFAELVERVADAGADEATFNALGGNDRPEFFPAHRLRRGDVSRLAELLPELRRRAAARGLLLRGSDAYLARLAAGAAGQAVPIHDCAPGRDFWFIEADGRLAPCAFTGAEYGVPIAGLRAAADLDALAARLGSARARRRAAACGDCPSTQVHEKFS